MGEQEFRPVRDLKKIAKRYVTGYFIWDILAVIPFELLFAGEKQQLWRMIKLLRLPKLF